MMGSIIVLAIISVSLVITNIIESNHRAGREQAMFRRHVIAIERIESAVLAGLPREFILKTIALEKSPS